MGLLVLSQATKLKLVQLPNHRSSHEHPTPNGGGMGIVLSSTIVGGFLVFQSSGSLSDPLLVILVLGLSLAVLGMLDDIRNIPAKWRFTAQVAVVSSVLLLLGDIPTVGLFVPLGLSRWVFVPGLLLMGVWWINLFNFMDGIDGIAGVQAITMLVASSVLMALTHPGIIGGPLWCLTLCIVAATLGFLLLNWPPARIFMGDSGSIWLGLMIFVLALLTVQQNLLSYATWLILAASFISDATITLLVRLSHGERGYEAHRTHAYQRLSRRWHGNRKTGHQRVTILVLSINVVWLAPLAWGALLSPKYSLIFLIMAYLPVVIGVVWAGAGRSDHS